MTELLWFGCGFLSAVTLLLLLGLRSAGTAQREAELKLHVPEDLKPRRKRTMWD